MTIKVNKDKKIKKVLNRLLSEETSTIEKCLKRINYLSHQLENFSVMRPEIQEEVKRDMFILMKKNGWEDWAKELEEELK